MKDEPPRIVVSIKAGEMPRYSLNARPEVWLCVVAQIRPSTSRSWRRNRQAPAGCLAPSDRSGSSPWRLRPNRIRRCRRSRRSRAAARPSHRPQRREYRVGRLVAAGAMNTEPDPHADPHRRRRNVFDPAHQPKALVTINEGDIIGRAFAWKGYRRGINRPETRAHPPFQTVAAGEGADDAWVKHCPVRLRAPLVNQLAAFEARLVHRQR